MPSTSLFSVTYRYKPQEALVPPFGSLVPFGRGARVHHGLVLRLLVLGIRPGGTSGLDSQSSAYVVLQVVAAAHHHNFSPSQRHVLATVYDCHPNRPQVSFHLQFGLVGPILLLLSSVDARG